MNFLHLETTTRCTLACPACPRTVWKDLLGIPVENQDLNYTLLEKFLDCKSGKQITGFNLCGDYGDTIYYPKLFDFIKDFRRYSFKIYTNGSFKNRNWWKELASLLSPEDEVIFAIDGVGQKENEKYRVNSNWDSIMVGIDVLRNNNIKLRCETLNFEFNIDKLDEIEKWANNNNMSWLVKKTHRFGNDNLIPSDEHVEIRERFQDTFSNNTPIKIIPRCDKAKVITSNNYFLPCDWIRNPLTFFKSDLYKEKKWLERLDIGKSTLDECLIVLEEWKEQVIEKGNSGTCSVLCKMKCRAND